MSDRKNVVASVLARLRNTSKSSGAPLQQVLQQYAWNAFVKKIGEGELVNGFGSVVDAIRDFAMPVLTSVSRSEVLTKKWRAGQGWID